MVGAALIVPLRVSFAEPEAALEPPTRAVWEPSTSSAAPRLVDVALFAHPIIDDDLLLLTSKGGYPILLSTSREGTRWVAPPPDPDALRAASTSPPQGAGAPVHARLGIGLSSAHLPVARGQPVFAVPALNFSSSSRVGCDCNPREHRRAGTLADEARAKGLGEDSEVERFA